MAYVTGDVGFDFEDTNAPTRAAKLRVPKDIRDALTLADSSERLKAPKVNTPLLVLPGILTEKKKYPYFLKDLHETIYKQDKELAAKQTAALTLAGHPMNPMGVPNVTSTSVPSHLRGKIKSVLKWIEYGSHMVFSEPGIIGSLPVSRISSVGFPYFHSGNVGLQISEAMIQSKLANISEISDLLAAGDFASLESPKREGMLPMYFVTTISRRYQADKATVSYDSNGRITSVVGKQRIVHTWEDKEVTASKVIEGVPWCTAERARPISAVSRSSNDLLQANVDPTRNVLYSMEVFHPSTVSDQIDLFTRNMGFSRRGEKGRVRSWDFKQFDQHMTAMFFEAVVSGAKRAGKSEAFINLFRKVHYSPFIIKNDYVGGRGYRMKGRVSAPIETAYLDLGGRSGEAGIDVINKLEGYGIVGACAFMAGLLGDLSEEEAMTAWWKRSSRLQPTQGFKVHPVVSAGDDALTHFEDPASEDAMNETFKSLAPTLEIEVEPIGSTEILGWSVDEVSWRAVPSMSKALVNHICPERGIDSPMRELTWQLGNIERDKYYMMNDQWPQLRLILDEVSRRHYGQTFLGASRSIPAKLKNVQIRSMADYLYIENPAAIHYRILIEEVSKEILDATQFYLNISPERVAQLQI